MTTKTRHSLAAAAFLAALATASPALAAYCAPHKDVAALLARSYKEQPRAMGLTLTGHLLEIYVSESGTWTTVVTSPGGRACIVSAGKGWMTRLAEKPGAGA